MAFKFLQSLKGPGRDLSHRRQRVDNDRILMTQVMEKLISAYAYIQRQEDDLLKKFVLGKKKISIV